MSRIYTGKYYFYFEYYTYIKITDTGVLLLNTLDNQKIISNEKMIITLIEKLLCKKNYVLEIDFDNFYTDALYQSFFDEVRNKYMGDLIDVKLSKGEPVNFYPIPKIEDNIRKKEKKNTPLDYNFLCNSLFNLNIFLNSVCTYNCSYCNDYCKQFNCCTKFVGNDVYHSIEDTIIEELFKYAKFENLKRIHILGGNISLYKDIDKALNYLTDYKESCYAYFKYNNIQSINKKILSFFDNRISITVDASEIDEKDVSLLINDYHEFEIQIVVSDELQIEKILPLTESTSISYKIVPFYNGRNLSFFENHVFMNEEDIFEMQFTIKKIHKNQHMNSFFFGNLTVLPDGNICIDMNSTALGNLKNESIFDILTKALKNEDSLWFKTRNTMTACSDCLFVDLCPPVSSYELVTGKSNPCNVKY